MSWIFLEIPPGISWKFVQLDTLVCVGLSGVHLDGGRVKFQSELDTETTTQVQRRRLASQLVHHRKHSRCVRRRQQGTPYSPTPAPRGLGSQSKYFLGGVSSGTTARSRKRLPGQVCLEEATKCAQ